MRTKQKLTQYQYRRSTWPRWLVLLLLSVGAYAGTVTVTRDLPDSVLTTTESFVATLEVAITGDAPNGVVVSEEVPSGWTISGATWEGTGFSPVFVGGVYKWLFGGVSGVPPANGTLSFTVNVSGGRAAVATYTFDGSAKWFENAVEQTSTTHGDTTVDALAPTTVQSVAVSDGLNVVVTFTGAMGAGGATPVNYTLSGSGKGTLSDHPDSVTGPSGNAYTVTWNGGEMLDGGDITVTVQNAFDAAGHPLGDPDSATDYGGGQGVAPEVETKTPPPDSVITDTDISVDIAFSETVTALDPGDLVLTGSAKLAGTAVGVPSDQGGNVWRFPVTGLGTGTLNVSLGSTPNGIEDLAGNDLAPVSWSYTVDVTPPEVFGIVPADGVFIETEDVNIDVTFSEAVMLISPPALSITGIAAGAASIGTPTHLGGNVWRFPITGLVDGALSVTVAPNPGDIVDAAGHELSATVFGYTVWLPKPHPYDANQNWVIEDAELEAVKSDWVAGNIAGYDDPDFFMLWAVELWKAGAYDYHRLETGYRVWQPVSR